MGNTVTVFDEFKSYYALADQPIEAMRQEQLADCLRILALHVADYRLRFGEIPGQELLSLLGTTEISDAQARMLREGMEVLVGYLASVRDGWEDEDAPFPLSGAQSASASDASAQLISQRVAFSGRQRQPVLRPIRNGPCIGLCINCAAA